MLVIPEGALDGPTAIRIVVATASPIQAMSPVFNFEPAGLTFKKPITAAFDVPGDARQALSVFWTRAGQDTFEEIPSTLTGNVITAETEHFSAAYVDPATVPDCDKPGVTKLDGCRCFSLSPHSTELCPDAFVQTNRRCECRDGIVSLCPVPFVNGDCPAPGNRKSWPAGEDGSVCGPGFDSTNETHASGITEACDPPTGPCEKPASFKGFPQEQCDGFAMVDNATTGVPEPRMLPGRMQCPGSGDVQDTVTCWGQVKQLQCRMNKNTDGSSCTSDSECLESYVCDKSAGCGCCVDAPLSPKPTTDTSRAFFSGCQAAPRAGCEAPRPIQNCTLNGVPFVSSPQSSTLIQGDVLVCELTTTAPQFTSAYSITTIDDARQQLCIKPEDWQKCMWEVKLPASGAVDVQKFPPNGYECGGRSCNDEIIYMVAPTAGQKYEIRLADDSGCR